MRGAVSSLTDSMLLSAISAMIRATSASSTRSTETPRTTASLATEAFSGRRNEPPR
jgi:hypothetical protein